MQACWRLRTPRDSYGLQGGGIVSWDAVWWYRAARRHSRDERLLTGVVVEGAAAEEHITTEKTFADKPSLTWAWEVEE